MKNPMDFTALCKEIQAENQRHLIQITHQSACEISIIDDTDMSRPICFQNCDKMDANWFLNHLWIHPSITSLDEKAIAEWLTYLDRNMFICLRHILFLRTIDDLDDYIYSMVSKADQEEMLDMMPSSTPDAIGQFWYYGSCIIVYFSPIQEIAHEISLSDNSNEFLQEMHAGIGVTLIHEARHLLFSNPFLPEEQYPELMNTEEKIESYARAEFDRIGHLSVFFTEK